MHNEPELKNYKGVFCSKVRVQLFSKSSVNNFQKNKQKHALDRSFHIVATLKSICAFSKDNIPDNKVTKERLLKHWPSKGVGKKEF